MCVTEKYNVRRHEGIIQCLGKGICEALTELNKQTIKTRRNKCQTLQMTKEM